MAVNYLTLSNRFMAPNQASICTIQLAGEARHVQVGLEIVNS
jgi:hypothetical protein